MTDSELAKRAPIPIGDLTIDGFMLADGSYRMSLTQTAECIDKPRMNAARFLDSKAIKALLGEGYTPNTIEAESTGQIRGQTRFNALPLEVVAAYWFNQSQQGNKKAIALIWAILTETLERRFDAAFGVERSTDDYNTQLSDRVQDLERILEQIGDRFAIEDDTKRERDYFLELLKQNGIEPYQPPDSESTDD